MIKDERILDRECDGLVEIGRIKIRRQYRERWGDRGRWIVWV